ncbi:MAG: alkane 1-monooxygenase [Bacteroidia bacterium]|nr:alkane 1-monooxygenase [Bacteroidia bacterium]
MFRSAKYLIAYLVPALVGFSLFTRGIWSYTTLMVLFGLVPVLEQVLRGSDRNLTEPEEQRVARDRVFDLLLYLNVPIQYGLLAYFLWIVTTQVIAPYEWPGLILSMGISCGTLGINVAHELGHRSKPYEQRMAQALLLTSLYLHFFIEHNRGHHKYVATPLDPATARYGEHVYAFWWRSIRDSLRSAWHLEATRMQKEGRPVWSPANQMVQFMSLQVLVVALIGLVLGPLAMVAFLAVALVGILLLETVNYLEHYGLLRRELRPGTYERVLPRHSWNSNRTIGRILLYELTRHSDHHYLASRKYQVLRHFDESPELPGGYPTMILLALVPPLWFAIMHPALETYQTRWAQPIRG